MGALAWSALVLLATPPPAEQSLLSTALAVAEKVSVPRMTTEENLTWQSLQLEDLARLYAKAGRFDQALRLVRELDTPERVKAPALGAIAAVALEAGDTQRAEALIRQLEKADEWTAPAALAAIARALDATGDHRGALRLARKVTDPGERCDLLLSLGGRDALREALRSAEEVGSGQVHVPVGQQLRWLVEWSERQGKVLTVVRAAVDRGELEVARAGLESLAKVEDSGRFVWRARALLAIARGEQRAGKSDAATLEQALAEVEAGMPTNMGEVSAKVDLLATLASRQPPAEAAKLLARAAELTRDVEKVPEVSIRDSVLSESLARLAKAHAEGGQTDEARKLLERLVRLAEAWTIPPPTPGSSWDSPSSERQNRVETFARAAAGFERIGASERAEAVLRQAVTEIGKIASPSWRGYAWKAIVEAYDAVDRLDRSVEILAADLTSDRAQNPDKLDAVQTLAERLSAAERPRLAPLIDALPPSVPKVELLVQLGPGARAAALAAVAAVPERWDLALVRLANADPEPGRRAEGEEAKLLAGLLGR